MDKDDKVVFMDEDNNDWSISNMVDYAMGEYEGGAVKADKAVLILLDTKSGGYYWKRYTSNMSDTELITLFEIQKSRAVDRMNED